MHACALIGGLFRLLHLVCAAAVADGPAGPMAPEQRSIGQLLAVPVTELPGHDLVRVEGTVTWVVQGRATMTIEDESGGMWVNCYHDKSFTERWLAMQEGIAVGTTVAVTGFLAPGGYAPHLRATRIDVLAHGPGVPRRQADLGRLFGGVDNATRVEIEGVVQGCAAAPRRGDWSLALVSQSRTVRLLLPDVLWREPPRHLVDAEVRVVAVAGAERNTRGEFLGPSLFVARVEDVVVTAPPPADPFTAPAVAVAALGRFLVEPRSGHRIVTEGLVTLAAPSGFFVLQHGLQGVRVALEEGTMPGVGDRVEVAGFVDMSRNVAGLTGAVARTLGRDPLPAPLAVAPDEIARVNDEAGLQGRMATPTSYEGCLIRFPATVVEMKRGDRDVVELFVTSGKSLLQARGERFAAVEAMQLTPGTEIELTGVMQIDFPAVRRPPHASEDAAIQRMTLLLRTADDIVVRRRPSWWTPARLAAAMGVVGAFLAVAVGWAESLRRRVRKITAQLSTEMQSRRDAAVEFGAALRERNRIAANLHDTLLQTLRGVDFQLGACRAYGEQSAGDPWEHLEVARRMVNHAAEELRGSVWALRTVPVPGGSFAESLEAIARQTGHGHAEHVAVRIEGEAFELPHFVSGNLLLVAQEALHNALQHADCGQIDVTASFDARAGSVALTIADDGRGFAKGTEAGPNQGHFGLTGMRERIERLGGTFAIESGPGLGTVVRARVLKRGYDPLIDVPEHASDSLGREGTAGG